MPVQGSLSVERMCRVAGVSRASFYRWLEPCMPVEEEIDARAAIQAVVLEHRRRYGYLAVVLDVFSRKVVGWALGRTLAASLPVAALQQAIEQRQPPPGLVRHSDRSLQYASEEYAKVLRLHGIVPSMSRPANPYDNAFCESFMRTLKREEIDARSYRDLDDPRAHVAEFIEQYYNRCRLHSALGYRPPEEFEQTAAAAEHNLAGGIGAASMSFFRHGEIYRPMGSWKQCGEPDILGSPAHRHDESPAGYAL